METPSVPPSSEIAFRVRLWTRWSDEDNHGVLNNAVYLTLFEEARHAYFSKLDAMQEDFFPFVLGQTNVSYLRPGHGARLVWVEVQTTRIGRTSLTQAYRVLPEEGEPWCEAEARLVFTEQVGAGSVPTAAPVPSELRAAIEALGRA